LLKLRDGIVELYKKVATSLPPDIREAMGSGLASEEEGSVAYSTLTVQIENMKSARETVRPVCQDTGVPTFWVKVPTGLGHAEMKNTFLWMTKGR